MSCFFFFFPSPLTAFRIFSLSFESLIIICLSVDLLGLILFGVYWALWMCRLMFFIKSMTFWAIIFSDILLLHLSFSSGTPVISVLVHLTDEARSAWQEWRVVLQPSSLLSQVTALRGLGAAACLLQAAGGRSSVGRRIVEL